MSGNFESALKELNVIVEKMEEGGLPLSESLKQFEKGVALIRDCQSHLKKAEQKIQIYSKGENTLEVFNPLDQSD